MSPEIAAIADELLDRVEGEDEIDFVRVLADPLPATVIGAMLGVATEDLEQVRAWSFAINNSTGLESMGDVVIDPDDPDDLARIRAGAAAFTSLREYFERSAAEHREDPQDDLIMALIEVEDRGDMSHGELLTMLQLLLLGGTMTVTDFLGIGLAVLLWHPRQYRSIRKDPSLMASAVEEMLRFAPPVLTTGRMLDSAQDVAGCPLPQHASVSVSIVGGNRDPDVFERPDEFDVARKKNPHLAFGGGIHFCLGASLARLQTRITRGWLFERYEEIELALPCHELEWRGRGSVRGLRSLPLRVTPRS